MRATVGVQTVHVSEGGWCADINYKAEPPQGCLSAEIKNKDT